MAVSGSDWTGLDTYIERKGKKNKKQKGQDTAYQSAFLSTAAAEHSPKG